MIENIFLETERLIIKNLEPDDISEINKQQKDEDIMKFFDGPYSDEKCKNITDQLYEHFDKYGFSAGLIYLKKTQKVIGRGGLMYLDFKGPPDVELFCFLYKPYQNQGYATELGNALITYAFEKLNCVKIYATIDPNNITSETAAKKLGMTLERMDTYETLDKMVMYYAKNNL